MKELELNEQSRATIALLPLKNVVILPKSIIPIIVGRQSSVEAVEYSLKHDKSIFITAQKHSDVEHPTEDDVFIHGTRSTILQVMRMPKGTLKILVEGIERAKIIKTYNNEKFLEVEIQDMPTTNLEDSLELKALWRQLKSYYTTYSSLNSKIPSDLMSLTKSVQDMDIVSDTLAVHLNLTFDERQELLELADLKERLIKLCLFVKREIDILETEERIKSNIQKQIEKSQKEYYLNEQIKAIQKELGKEDTTTEIFQIKNKIKTLKLTPEALEKVEKEIRRLEQMPALSSEAVVSRHYIDWIISIPWDKASKDVIGIEEAESILNHHHAGLKKAKERIIEFLAAKKFSKKFKRSPVICLIGPPGVGKTSLAKSISESLGREFVRISLGGVKDEAEIRGHRRTYIGSLPGKIIQAMRKAKTINPVILLDEIDKMASDYHGDPSAALLEVLDPEQNKNFVDHFLEVGYDLSQVLFITTANHREGIPYPLYDRMEKISLSGYTEAEKVEIATSFLMPKNLKEYGLTNKQFILPKDIMELVISEYTRESGVRQLERLIAKLMRKVIQILLKDKKIKSVTVNKEHISQWLGYPIFKRSLLDLSADRIGVATGLAWTEVGGDILEIEVTAISGKGGLTLTGQLGDVMQESAHAALSYIRSRTSALGISASFNSTKDIHVHIPEGATPKDGPSAGITMCVALVSALTKNPTKAEVAMTGEVTLRGRVLAVGGLKEKILAARQYGLKTVLVPEENRSVVEEIIQEIGQVDHLNIVFVSNMDEVLKLALGNDPFELKSEKEAQGSELSKKKTVKKTVKKPVANKK